jgi:hypothetical protein
LFCFFNSFFSICFHPQDGSHSAALAARVASCAGCQTVLESGGSTASTPGSEPDPFAPGASDIDGPLVHPSAILDTAAAQNVREAPLRAPIPDPIGRDDTVSGPHARRSAVFRECEPCRGVRTLATESRRAAMYVVEHGISGLGPERLLAMVPHARLAQLAIRVATVAADVRQDDTVREYARLALALVHTATRGAVNQ